MIISVLLQPGKADAGALFTSSVSSAAFGPRGTQSILAKITIFAAATFMITALLLTMGVGGQGSLMEGAKAKPTPAATPAQQASPQTDAAPAAPPQESVPPANATATPSTTESPKPQASPAGK
jgi:protein translocase SecG subunit